MIALWLFGNFRYRSGRLLGAVTGVAITVGLVASLGAFLFSSAATMTKRTLAGVPVDWQVQLMPGTNLEGVVSAIGQAAPVAFLQPAGYADAGGFEAHTGGSVQTTGAGKVLGIDPAYLTAFPGQLRVRLGSSGGVMLAQQTAANLHVTVGDSFAVQRIGLPQVDLTVTGIVDLPNADAMFQAVGVPAGAAPQAPPDNVALVPLSDWHRLFDPQANLRPDTVRLQLHVRLDRNRLPANPDDAFAAALSAGHNLEARVAGGALLGNTVAARLDAVRKDALYARVLFLFLGAPGVAIAILLTLAVAASGGERRRREQALLRVRGASMGQIFRLAAAESAAIGIAGAVAGLALAEAMSRLLLGADVWTGPSTEWLAAAVLTGLALALAAILVPAWHDARSSTVANQRASIGERPVPLWRRGYLDFALLAGAGAMFWQSASTGYQVVLAPEGVPAASVDYLAFLSPFLLWLGLGLLTLRLGDLLLDRARPMLRRLLTPLAGSLAGVVSASLSRQRRRVIGGIALTALAFAFATSTAIFNRTYEAQALVDAQLTNGADVSVSAPPFTDTAAYLAALKSIPGVVAAEPMQHRLAYVGADLQDLYGIDPARIGAATTMSNAYFGNGDALAALALLARTPDGVLVSDETVKDFQLTIGDQINLRLQNAADHQYRTVPFKLAGIVREFPTAPHDSFLVANASYIGSQTGSAAAEIVLLKASLPPDKVAAAVRKQLVAESGLVIGEIGETKKIIGSSLTVVDLGGLTRLELTFAMFAIAASAGLILALGLADRKRDFAILSLLGAKRQQLAGFLWSEGLVIFVVGAVTGLLTGVAIAAMLVRLLTGVFDPPPEAISIPWVYLTMLLVAAFASIAVAILLAIRATSHGALKQLRNI